MEGTLSIAQLVLLAHTFKTETLNFRPEKFQLSEYEQSVTPALIGRLLGNVGIDKARPRYRTGRVASFDVTPVQITDPVIVVCPNMDLSNYYRVWGEMVKANRYDLRMLFIYYDGAMQTAIRSARELQEDEIHFAICEMLHFRNAMMGRTAQWS